MKKIMVLGLILGLFCFSTTGYSQAKKTSFKIAGGIGVPLGDWSEYYNFGFGGNGSIIYPIQPQIDLIGGLEFFYFTGESAKYKYRDYTWETDFTLSRIIFFGDGRYNFKGKPAFFAQGGLGIYYDKEKIEGDYEHWYYGKETFSVSDTDTNLGIRLGGGIVFTNIEVMGMFHIIGDRNMFIVTVSLRF